MDDDDDFLRCLEVLYLDSEMRQVSEADAVFAKVVYEDGTVQILELE